MPRCREVGLIDGLGWVHGGTSLVYKVWYIVSVYGKKHCWRIRYGTSLVHTVWYIVDLYGTVHCWFLNKT